MPEEERPPAPVQWLGFRQITNNAICIFNAVLGCNIQPSTAALSSAFFVALECGSVASLPHPWAYKTWEMGLLGPQIPKFDTATQAILKFDTATGHNLKIDMPHAIEATRDTIPLLSATNDTSLTDTKIDKCRVSFFFRKRFWVASLVKMFALTVSLTMNYQKLCRYV